MQNEEIIKGTSKIIIEKHKGDFSIFELVSYLFESGIADVKRCRIALIRRRFYQLLQNNSQMKIGTAKDIISEEFEISVSSVDKAIYYFKDITL